MPVKTMNPEIILKVSFADNDPVTGSAVGIHPCRNGIGPVLRELRAPLAEFFIVI
jgi:hypothetical protein